MLTDPVRPGEIWQLGDHRLACGDCTDAALVQALMQGEHAAMLFTDPPYGIRYSAPRSHRRVMAGDNLHAEDVRSLVARALAAAPLRPGGAFYLCSSPGPAELAFRLGIEDSGLRLRQCLVWVKSHFVVGGHDYHMKHESILYGCKDGGPRYFVGDRKQHSVWEYKKPQKSPLHPTMKPLPLVARAILNSSLPGEIVYDGFGGSGTTLIACERTGRRCRMVEIDPEYCAVIVRRWESETGRTAELLGRLLKEPHTGISMRREDRTDRTRF